MSITGNWDRRISRRTLLRGGGAAVGTAMLASELDDLITAAHDAMRGHGNGHTS